MKTSRADPNEAEAKERRLIRLKQRGTGVGEFLKGVALVLRAVALVLVPLESREGERAVAVEESLGQGRDRAGSQSKTGSERSPETTEGRCQQGFNIRLQEKPLKGRGSQRDDVG